MEKNPDSYNDADLDEIKVKIKQVEALIKELKLSLGSSTTVFESLHAQVSPVDGNNHTHRINRETVLLKKKKCLFSDHHRRGDLGQAGKYLRQERGPADTSGVPEGAAAAGGVRETPPGDFQPQHWWVHSL